MLRIISTVTVILYTISVPSAWAQQPDSIKKPMLKRVETERILWRAALLPTARSSQPNGLNIHSLLRVQTPGTVLGKEFNFYQERQTQFVRMPATTFGPSGLLFTQSTDILPPGKAEVGLSVVNEHSSIPDYTLNKILSTLTFGLEGAVELAVQIPYMFKFERAGEQKDAMEDVNLSLKWRFLEPGINVPFPAMALSLSYFLPTANPDRGFGLVDSWGLRTLLLSSAEVDIAQPVASYVIGLYLDAGAFMRNVKGNSGTDTSGILDVGVLLPLTESRRIQLLLEGNITWDNYIEFQGNYTAITAGLRYVNLHINVTGGMQQRFKRDDGVDNTRRLVLQLSYLF